MGKRVPVTAYGQSSCNGCARKVVLLRGCALVSASMLLVAAVSQGCSSSSSASSGDAAAGQDAATSDDSPSAADAGFDSTVPDDGAPGTDSATRTDGPLADGVAADGPSDARAPDSTAGDAGADALSVQDAAVDQASGDAVADASGDAGSDAGLVGSGCVTVIDGGTLLFGFDNGNVNGWLDDPTSNPASTVAGTSTDGVTCPGALSYTVPFTAYSQRSLVDFNWGTATPLVWSASKLHFWVKILAPTAADYQGLLLVQPMMLWNSWADGDYTMFQFVNPTLADGSWHEVVMDITQGGAPFLQAVDGFRFLAMDQQLAADGGPPDAGPPMPATVQYLFDDVWLE